MPEWTSPTGHNDPDSKWILEEHAYDGDMGSPAINDAADQGHYLELSINSIDCNQVRIYIFGLSWMLFQPIDINVDVYYNSAWHNIYSGVIDCNVPSHFVAISLGATYSVTKARVKANEDDQSDGCRFLEFEFYNIWVPSEMEGKNHIFLADSIIGLSDIFLHKEAEALYPICNAKEIAAKYTIINPLVAKETEGKYAIFIPQQIEGKHPICVGSEIQGRYSLSGWVEDTHADGWVEDDKPTDEWVEDEDFIEV